MVKGINDSNVSEVFVLAFNDALKKSTSCFSLIFNLYSNLKPYEMMLKEKSSAFGRAFDVIDKVYVSVLHSEKGSKEMFKSVKTLIDFLSAVLKRKYCIIDNLNIHQINSIEKYRKALKEYYEKENSANIEISKIKNRISSKCELKRIKEVADAFGMAASADTSMEMLNMLYEKLRKLNLKPNKFSGTYRLFKEVTVTRNRILEYKNNLDKVDSYFRHLFTYLFNIQLGRMNEVGTSITLRNEKVISSIRIFIDQLSLKINKK